VLKKNYDRDGQRLKELHKLMSYSEKLLE